MSLPVISISQMREWEQATWVAGQPQAEVIRRVGKCVARRAREVTQAQDFILLLAGKGHNGDDVRAARAHLMEGRRVELLEVTDPAASLAPLEVFLGQNPALVIDGLFGIGLNRALSDDWVAFITRLNGSGPRILAVDVPSGLNADTGDTFGAAVQATVTLTVGAPKRGLLAPSAWPYVGRLEVATATGLSPCPQVGEQRWTQPEDFQGFPPARPAAGHKGSFGHLAVLAGSVGYHGAAVLAARGAQRAQPGLVTVFTHEPAYFQVAIQLQSAMVSAWSPEVRLPGDFSGILLGPGLASPEVPTELRNAVRRVWDDVLVPVVADASALDWLPMGHVPRNVVRVMTPHPGEAARLMRSTPARVQEHRVLAVRELSKKFGDCWVVLKGHQTLIGRSGGEIFVNSSGNPHLAQGGSGDVLAGFIAGLLAQPDLQADPGRALRYAVWQHGAAADRLQSRRRNWTVEDLVSEIGDGS